jgi:MoxR-like ATPase
MTTILNPDEVQWGKNRIEALLSGLNERILGQEELTRRVVVACLARGNVLLEGLPGLGKTELVKGLAGLLGLDFRRIQFTPDLLPSDITGAGVLEEVDGRREMRFVQGPIFGNLILADEINRASPRTQSAMLEAMQEQRVSVMGNTYELPDPFWCMATQNPIDMEGTYPLPEAQLDRFLFKLHVTQVSGAVMSQIIQSRRRGRAPEPTTVLQPGELEQLFGLVERVFLPTEVAEALGRLVEYTHPSTSPVKKVQDYVRYGASPRAAIGLAEAVRVHALMFGKPNVGLEDVRALAPNVLGHRLALDYRAKLDGVTVWELIDEVVNAL